MGRRFPGRGVGAGLSTVLAVGAGVFTNAATSEWTWSTGVGLVVFAGGWVGLEMWRAARADGDQGVRAAEVPQERVRMRRGSLDPPAGSAPPWVRGRAGLVAALADQCGLPDGSMHVLTGLGGVGKTTVALELARRAAADGVRVWWVTVRDRQALANDLLDLLVGLGATRQEVRQVLSGVRSVVDLVWRYLETQTGRWLLVIDNADQPELLAADGARVADGNGVARGSHRGLVVVTSRVTTAELWGVQAVLHRIDALATEDAARVVADLAPRAGSDDEAAALAARLGGLPLALRAAGRYLNSPQAQLDGVSSFAAYQAILDQEAPPGTTVQPLVSLEAAWDASLDLLGRQGLPHARAVLRMLGGFAAAPVPAWVVDGPTLYRSLLFGSAARPAPGRRLGVAAAARGRRYDKTLHRDTVAALCQLGLLDLDGVGPDHIVCLVAHPLVFEVNAAWLAAHPSAGRTVRATVIGLLANAVHGRDAHDAAQYRLWPLLVAHLLHALDTVAAAAPADQLALLVAANATSWGLTRAGYHLTALGLATATAEASSRLLPPDHPQRLHARHHIACAFSELGRLREAAGEFAAVLADRTRVLGAEHVDTLASRMNQADVLMQQGRYEQAEAEFRSVYDIQRRVCGDRSRDALLTASNLAQALTHLGRYEQAETEFRVVLAMQRSALGERHSNTLGTRRAIAAALAGQRRYAEAEAGYRATLALAREVLGPEHPWTLQAQHGLAEVLVCQHAHGSAEAELRAVLAARTRVLGDAHPDTLASRYWLAELLAQRGDRDRAVAEFHAVMSGQRQALDPRHPDLRRTRESIDRWQT